MKRQIIPLVVMAVSMALATQSSADPQGYPSGRPFQAIEQDFETVLDAIGDIQVDVGAIEEDIDTIKNDVGTIQTDIGTIQTDVTSVKSDVSAIKTEVEALADVLTVEVVINTTACSSAASQCGGFPNGDPVEGNNSPIQLVAFVSRGGLPVTGLEFTDFSFTTGTVAPGGSLIVFCETECGSFFGEAGAGIYQMFLKPFDVQDWDDGVYTGSIAATDPAGSGVALASFSIPSAAP